MSQGTVPRPDSRQPESGDRPLSAPDTQAERGRGLTPDSAAVSWPGSRRTLAGSRRLGGAGLTAPPGLTWPRPAARGQFLHCGDMRVLTPAPPTTPHAGLWVGGSTPHGVPRPPRAPHRRRGRRAAQTASRWDRTRPGITSAGQISHLLLGSTSSSVCLLWPQETACRPPGTSVGHFPGGVPCGHKSEGSLAFGDSTDEPGED